MAKRHNFINILQEFSIPLITGVLAAVVWANYDFETYHHIMHAHLLGSFFPMGESHPISFHYFINDIFMAIFFGIAAKEITESTLPGGALNPPSKAVNPLLGTLGGVFGPVGVYFAYVAFSGAGEITNGWGIPTATDIALAWLVARLVFGKGHPAVAFLLLLAVADDGIGLGIIAIFYGDPNNPANPTWLILVVIAMLLAHLMRKKQVRSFWPYMLVPGIISWFGLIMAHLHPALALVFVVPFMPNAKVDTGMFVEDDGTHASHDTLNEFEHFWKLPVDLFLFGFGLANAGVQFSSMGHATFAVLLALVVGKAAGITLFSWFGTKIGFPLPDGMDIRSLFLAGVVAALGLTVALFVAGVAFTDLEVQGAAKMGALLSAFVAPLAWVVGRLLGISPKAQE